MLPVSLERLYENALDWEHLPHLHQSSFASITCEAAGPWGWRAVTTSPRVRLDADSDAAFAQTYGITYPSAIASETPSIKLAFAEKTPIQATPTTLVLDAEGRVAARIIGQLPDRSILTTLVRETLEESS